MGVDFYIGDEQFRITNAHWYNKFLDWVADTGLEYEQILSHSPIHGRYQIKPRVLPSLYDGSVLSLLRELETLRLKKPPDWAEDIISEMVAACELAIDNNHDISLDDGAWFGG